MKRLTILINILLFCLLTTTANANSIYIVDISGNIDYVDPLHTPLGTFAVGDQFSGRFIIGDPEIWDIGSTIYNSTEGTAEYGGSPNNGTVTIERVSNGFVTTQYTVSNTMDWYVTNNRDSRGDYRDGFSAVDSNYFYPPDNSGSIYFSYDDPSGLMFSNYEIPSSVPDAVVAGDVVGRFALSFVDSYGIKGEITNTSISVVPIPPAFWLLGSALVGLGFIKKRKA